MPVGGRLLDGLCEDAGLVDQNVSLLLGDLLRAEILVLEGDASDGRPKMTEEMRREFQFIRSLNGVFRVSPQIRVFHNFADVSDKLTIPNHIGKEQYRVFTHERACVFKSCVDLAWFK